MAEKKRSYEKVTPKQKTDSENEPDEFDNMFKKFNESESEHSDDDFVDESKDIPKKAKSKTSKPKDGETTEDSEGSEEEKKFNFEAQKIIFVKVANFAFSGIHLLIFNAIGKTKIKFNEILLTADELERLDSYVTEEMVKIIDFIPPWVFPIVHMEAIYLDKWRDLVKTKEVEAEALKKQKEEKKKEKESETETKKKK